MPHKETERIRKDLERHGFPLEIEVSQVLSNAGWNVADKYFFVDDETKKTREIDCFAMKGLSKPEIDLSENSPLIWEENMNALRLVVECKKSVKPWLFYTTRNDLLSILYTKFLGKLPINFPTHNDEEKHRNREFLSNLHSYSVKGVRLAINYFEPFTQGKGSQILDACMKVIKALRYDQEKLKNLVSGRMVTNFLLMYYPTIIFEGNLYEYLVERGESQILPIEYLQLNVNYQDEVYRLDVVHKDFFLSHLKNLDSEIKGLKEFFDARKKQD